MGMTPEGDSFSDMWMEQEVWGGGVGMLRDAPREMTGSSTLSHPLVWFKHQPEWKPI